jgi:hypothetical protein
MPSINEALNSKPPLGAALAAGVQTLSANQQIHFSLYQRYVFPLDGMVYWIKVPSQIGSITTPGVQTYQGITQTAKDSEAVQVIPGSVTTDKILGGMLVNPLDPQDQELEAAESLFVDFTGPADDHVTATTSELQPGESIEIPANNPNGAWVCAVHGGHKFSCIYYKSVSQVELSTDIMVQGSFHYASATEQREDAIVDSNDVYFTALTEIQAFNQIGPEHLYIGDYDNIRFAFSSRAKLYEQADLYHYQGKAIFSTSETQVIDDPSKFNPTQYPSNSTPIWISLSSYVPPYPTFECPCPLYPSYLVDDNLIPPFGSVHVEETKALGMVPYMGSNSRTAHLCRDKVKIHLYGLDNEQASDFLLFVENYSRDWMTLGLANSPMIEDVKHPQPELKTIAKRKLIEFEVNYLQSVVRDIARQFILHARVQFYDPHWYTDPT